MFTRFAASLSACLFTCAIHAQAESYDLIISGGTVHNGRGEIAKLDLGIRGARIAALGDLKKAVAKRRIDASGLVVAPGFIDVHAHADRVARRRPRADNYVLMGVTTIVTGNCGRSELDLDTHYRAIEKNGISLNYASLIGHATVRIEVMKLARRAPTKAELAQMQELVRTAMRAGAVGMSTGLIYVPGTYAATDELIALAEVVAEFDGLYASHMRNEGNRVLKAIDEALTIGKTAGVHVHLSHLKATGKPNWGNSSAMLARLVYARAMGQRVTGDQYAYTASSTGLDVLFPTAAREIGRKAFSQKLAADPAFRAEMTEHLFRKMDQYGFDDLAFCLIASAPDHTELNGETIRSAAKKVLAADDRAAQAEMTIRLMIDAGSRRVSMVYHKMCEPDVERIMRAHFIGVAADAGIRLLKTASKPHPRGAGNNPRVLGHYVRERKTLPLATAITKMTHLPASTFQLEDRGEIRIGAFADVVLFDPDTVADRATYKDPGLAPIGIPHVFVNGVQVVANGTHTDAKPGQVLRHRQ